MSIRLEKELDCVILYASVWQHSWKPALSASRERVIVPRTSLRGWSIVDAHSMQITVLGSFLWLLRTKLWSPHLGESLLPLLSTQTRLSANVPFCSIFMGAGPTASVIRLREGRRCAAGWEQHLPKSGILSATGKTQWYSSSMPCCVLRRQGPQKLVLNLEEQ